MQVIKRDGTTEEYLGQKIERAVEKAMFATYLVMEPTMLAEPFQVSLYVWDIIKDTKEPISIKQLENIIFRKLTDDGYTDAAVNYIEYKTKRDMERSKHKLTQEFLDKYPDYPDCMDELAKFVYIRTYSRWLPDKNRRETWKETCARAINGNCSYLPTADGEPEALFDNMFNLRQRISGRMLWMGGTEALEKTPLAAYNCSGITMDSIHAFHELFYLLMVGTGVGCRVLKEDIAKLPQFDTTKKLYHVKTPVPKGTTLEHTKLSNYGHSVIITVGDSKEGWCEALTAYLTTMTDNVTTSISIDYSYIRPQGVPLKTFGGYASGYASLKEMFEKLHKIITKESTNGKLRPLNVADMCNIVGQNVVAGGTRRTAELILFSPDDEEMLHAKENLDPEHYFRYMSNNSMYLEEKPSKEGLRKLMMSIKETGEPGFINVASAKKRREDFDICNPCVTGTTEILTKEYGYIQIKDVVDEDVTVWNGYDWSPVTPRVTGYDQPMMRVQFSNGNELECTNYHKFVMQDGSRIEARELCIGDKLERWEFPVVEADERAMGIYYAEDYDPYIHGYYAGDGIQNKPLIYLYGEKRKLVDVFSNSSRCTISKGLERDTVLLPKQLSKYLVPDVGDAVYHRLRYLAGLLDSTGCVHFSEGSVAISSIDKEFLIKISRLLNTLGCHASIHLMHEGGYRKVPVEGGPDDNQVYYCQPTYKLIISAWYVRRLINLGLSTHYIHLDAYPNSNDSQAIYITSIEYIRNCPTVYCFTENKNHTGIFNGVMTGQCAEILLPSKAVCNLTNINVSKFIDERGNVMIPQLKEACKLSARACYRLTEPELELEGWSDIHHRDRLIGCSITGWQDAVAGNLTKEEQEALLVLMKMWINDAANEYADENHRPHPVLYTTVQPDGTGGLISSCSAGVHYNHAPYYFRRVRISTNSPLYQAVKYLDGWQIDNEVGQGDNGNTKVITFPCKSKSTITKYNVSAIEQLEQYKMMQTCYVDHNTSITVTVKDNEWDDVIDWLDKNWDCVVGISFLSLNQDYYPLMPYEECTKEQYLELKSKMAPLDPELVNKYEFELQTVGKDFEIDESGECEDGHCPVR